MMRHTDMCPMLSSKTNTLCFRAQMAIMAALLHDVVDDTAVDLAEVSARFGAKVADIVHFVSRLSDVNQLLRRQLRHEVSHESSYQRKNPQEISLGH